TATVRRVLPGHPHSVLALAFSPDGQQLATVGGEKYFAGNAAVASPFFGRGRRTGWPVPGALPAPAVAPAPAPPAALPPPPPRLPPPAALPAPGSAPAPMPKLMPRDGLGLLDSLTPAGLAEGPAFGLPGARSPAGAARQDATREYLPDHLVRYS